MTIGIWKLILVLLIVFVLFGAGKLPKVMGDIGKGVKNLKEGLKGLDADEAPKKQIAAKKTVAAKKVASGTKKKSTAKKKKAA